MTPQVGEVYGDCIPVTQVNIIPKWVNFTVDVRCKRQEFRQEVVELAEARVRAVCAKRGVNCTITRTHDAPPVREALPLVQHCCRRPACRRTVGVLPNAGPYSSLTLK